MQLICENDFECLAKTGCSPLKMLTRLETINSQRSDPLALDQGFAPVFILCKLLIYNKLVGERGFEPPTPWSRTWGQGADFVVIQSFEWCFNRLILARSRQFGRNVNPPIATLARVSFHLGEPI